MSKRSSRLLAILFGLATMLSAQTNLVNKGGSISGQVIWVCDSLSVAISSDSCQQIWTSRDTWNDTTCVKCSGIDAKSPNQKGMNMIPKGGKDILAEKNSIYTCWPIDPPHKYAFLFNNLAFKDYRVSFVFKKTLPGIALPSEKVISYYVENPDKVNNLADIKSASVIKLTPQHPKATGINIYVRVKQNP